MEEFKIIKDEEPVLKNPILIDKFIDNTTIMILSNKEFLNP